MPGLTSWCTGYHLGRVKGLWIISHPDVQGTVTHKGQVRGLVTKTQITAESCSKESLLGCSMVYIYRAVHKVTQWYSPSNCSFQFILICQCIVQELELSFEFGQLLEYLLVPEMLGGMRATVPLQGEWHLEYVHDLWQPCIVWCTSTVRCICLGIVIAWHSLPGCITKHTPPPNWQFAGQGPNYSMCCLQGQCIQYSL